LKAKSYHSQASADAGILHVVYLKEEAEVAGV